MQIGGKGRQGGGGKGKGSDLLLAKHWPKTGRMHWSNALVKRWSELVDGVGLIATGSSGGQNWSKLAKLSCHMQEKIRRQKLVKRWSNVRATGRRRKQLVKNWSKTGQTLVKHWSKEVGMS